MPQKTLLTLIDHPESPINLPPSMLKNKEEFVSTTGEYYQTCNCEIPWTISIADDTAMLSLWDKSVCLGVFPKKAIVGFNNSQLDGLQTVFDAEWQDLEKAFWRAFINILKKGETQLVLFERLYEHLLTHMLNEKFNLDRMNKAFITPDSYGKTALHYAICTNSTVLLRKVMSCIVTMLNSPYKQEMLALFNRIYHDFKAYAAFYPNTWPIFTQQLSDLQQIIDTNATDNPIQNLSMQLMQSPQTPPQPGSKNNDNNLLATIKQLQEEFVAKQLPQQRILPQTSITNNTALLIHSNTHQTTTPDRKTHSVAFFSSSSAATGPASPYSSNKIVSSDMIIDMIRSSRDCLLADSLNLIKKDYFKKSLMGPVNNYAMKPIDLILRHGSISEVISYFESLSLAFEMGILTPDEHKDMLLNPNKSGFYTHQNVVQKTMRHGFVKIVETFLKHVCDEKYGIFPERCKNIVNGCQEAAKKYPILRVHTQNFNTLIQHYLTLCESRLSSSSSYSR